MTRTMGSIAAVALVVALGLGARGAVAQCCGDCNGDAEVTVDEIIIAVNRTLVGCADDGICSAASCPGQLAACQTELAACRAQGAGLPATGQTTAYGPGSDGAVRAGAALAYTDNGDGTVTDNNTGLTWEKKDDSNGIHGQNTGYTWSTGSTAGNSLNGTVVTEFLAALNRQPCFAGHCDWRLPNIKELQSIVDYEVPFPGPTVNAAFHNAAGCTGCTDLTLPTCSCTRSLNYWSSTTSRSSPQEAWYVGFFGGVVGVDAKVNRVAVRAVRGGAR